VVGLCRLQRKRETAVTNDKNGRTNGVMWSRSLSPSVHYVEMTGRSRRREHRGQFVREVKRWKLTELLVGIFLLLARRGAARLNFELRLNVGQKVKIYGT
jgi:hypothetical protein